MNVKIKKIGLAVSAVILFSTGFFTGHLGHNDFKAELDSALRDNREAKERASELAEGLRDAEATLEELSRIHEQERNDYRKLRSDYKRLRAENNLQGDIHSGLEVTEQQSDETAGRLTELVRSSGDIVTECLKILGSPEMGNRN